MNCSKCKWWQMPEDQKWAYEGLTHDRDANHEPIEPAVRKFCKSLKVVFYERPDADGCAVVDGSQYHAELITGPDFGCVNGEES